VQINNALQQNMVSQYAARQQITPAGGQQNTPDLNRTSPQADTQNSPASRVTLSTEGRQLAAQLTRDRQQMARQERQDRAAGVAEDARESRLQQQQELQARSEEMASQRAETAANNNQSRQAAGSNARVDLIA